MLTVVASEAQAKTRNCYLALISGRQMHRINARIFLVAITKKPPTIVGGFLALFIRSD